jgi:hypothetical protein
MVALVFTILQHQFMNVIGKKRKKRMQQQKPPLQPQLLLLKLLLPQVQQKSDGTV